jgi:Tfp pilus assembly protein PilO
MDIHSGIDLLMGLVIAGVGFWAKSMQDEVNRLSILLNRTREEVVRDYVTKADNNAAMIRVLDRFDRIEEKIDRLMARQA